MEDDDVLLSSASVDLKLLLVLLAEETPLLLVMMGDGRDAKASTPESSTAQKKGRDRDEGRILRDVVCVVVYRYEDVSIEERECWFF